MDLALAQLQGDIIIGFDAGELLGDVQHFDDIIFCQPLHAPFDVYRLVHNLVLYIIQKISFLYKRFCTKSGRIMVIPSALPVKSRTALRVYRKNRPVR